MKKLNCHLQITGQHLSESFRELAENNDDKTFNKTLVDMLDVSVGYWNEDTVEAITKYILKQRKPSKSNVSESDKMIYKSFDSLSPSFNDLYEKTSR